MDNYDKYNIRNAHTLSFDWKNVNNPTEMVPIHQVAVHVNRASCYPALPPDNSKELVDETTNRRNVHHDMMMKDHTSFRRQESQATKFQQDLVKQYSAGGIHILKDPHEKRSFTYSRVVNPTPTDIDFPARDFNFSNPQHDRTTGYSNGHIRSITKMDTIGPRDSMNRHLLVQSGQLPESYNNDRYMTGSGIISQDSQAMHGMKSTITEQSSAWVDNLNLKQYTAHERATHYFKEYKSSIQEKKSRKEDKETSRKMKLKVALESAAFYNSIDEFERKITPAKYS